MSGNATTHPVRRITTEELYRVQGELGGQLPCLWRHCGFPTSLTGKATHGDVDVVIAGDEWDTSEMPEGAMGVNHRNGFTHIAYPLGDGTYVQVDFITVPQAKVTTAKVYYSHGALGNHIGMLCRSIGLRYGHQGLRRIVYDPVDGHKLGDVTVPTRGPVHILQLLGLPAVQTEQIITGSFKTREESYSVLPYFPFFNTNAFNLDRMTAANRIRERKRPETTNLLDWLAANVPVSAPLPEERAKKKVYADTWQRRLFGKNIMDILWEMEDGFIEAARMKKETKDWKQEWFALFAEGIGVPVKQAGVELATMASYLNIKIEDYIACTTPNEASERWWTLYETTRTDLPSSGGTETGEPVANPEECSTQCGE